MSENEWTWRVVDADGNVEQESYEPIVLESTTQLGELIESAQEGD